MLVVFQRTQVRCHTNAQDSTCRAACTGALATFENQPPCSAMTASLRGCVVEACGSISTALEGRTARAGDICLASARADCTDASAQATLADRDPS